jgi:signal transduction histidine kinase
MTSTERSPSKAVLDALYEINASVLSSSQSNVAPLQIVARHARKLTDADLATIAVPSTDPTLLELRVADGPQAKRLVGTTFPIETSLSGEVFTTGQPVMLPGDAKNAGSRQPTELGSMGPVVIAPLVNSGGPFGTLAVARSRARTPFTLDDRDIAVGFAAHASMVIHLAQSQQALLALADADRRERLARDLHDTVMQRLYGISLSFQSLVPLVPVESSASIEQLITELDTTITEIRSTIFE